MGKVQWFVLLLLVAAISVKIVASIPAKQEFKQGHPIGAVQQLDPKLLLYWPVAFIALELLSDVAPEFAVGIAILIFVGSLLSIGPQGVGGK